MGDETRNGARTQEDLRRGTREKIEAISIGIDSDDTSSRPRATSADPLQEAVNAEIGTGRLKLARGGLEPYGALVLRVVLGVIYIAHAYLALS